MRARLTTMLIFLASSGAALAQIVPNAPPSSADAPRRIGEQVFIAPSGEPYRAAAGLAYPVVAWFAACDTNHDGRISQSEFSASFARFFDALDMDHDGALRSEEIQRYEKDVTPEVRSFGDGNRGGYRRSGFDSSGEFARLNEKNDEDQSADVGKSTEIAGDLRNGPMGAGRYALINIPEPIAAMDVDFNGVVTRNEMLSAARRRFALLDPQGKGALTLSDLPQTWAQAHPRDSRRR